MGESWKDDLIVTCFVVLCTLSLMGGSFWLGVLAKWYLAY